MRPDWDSYFMALCFVIAQRSLDPETKHGTVVVAKDHTILAIGYNGPPRNCSDDRLWTLSRPEKYDWMVHSEEAAIANAAKHGISIDNSVFYVTGFPCNRCMKLMINAGASKIIYGNKSSTCVDSRVQNIVREMAGSHVPPIDLVSYNSQSAISILEAAKEEVNGAADSEI